MKVTNMTPLRYMWLLVGLVAMVMVLPAKRKPLVASTGPRVSAVCMECHEGYDTSLDGTTHGLSSDALDGVGARITCTDCHAVDSRHYEEDPAAYPAANPDKLTAAATAQVCAACHQNSHQQNMVEKNIHFQNEVSCGACHSVHESKQEPLLRQHQIELCQSCHANTVGEFSKPYRHPLSDRVMTCTECHMTLDLTSRDLSLNGSNVCARCHAEFGGPFPYEHQATLDFSTEEGACITCHDAHGSFNPRMLKQPYEPPHFQQCSQCHTVPKHNSNVNHGTMWAGVACNECHTDIHGSYVSRKFLSESLQAQGCFNGSCHQF